MKLRDFVLGCKVSESLLKNKTSMGKEQTGLLAALWHYMSEHFCVPVFTHFACRYYTSSRQELASQEPLRGHSPLFELGPAIQRLGLRCMPLAPTPFQMTTTTTTIPTTKNYRESHQKHKHDNHHNPKHNHHNNPNNQKHKHQKHKHNN